MPACNFVESLTALIIVVSMCKGSKVAECARIRGVVELNFKNRCSNMEAMRLVTVAGHVEETLYVVAS
jgi:hypothetical protein